MRRLKVRDLKATQQNEANETYESRKTVQESCASSHFGIGNNSKQKGVRPDTSGPQDGRRRPSLHEQRRNTGPLFVLLTEAHPGERIVPLPLSDCALPAG